MIEHVLRGLTCAPDELRDRVHYHLSALSNQDAAVTHEDMFISLTQAIERGELSPCGTYWEKTDGCAKQYRCALALYLLSLLASLLRVHIDRQVDVSGHGKDKGNEYGALNKGFFRRQLLLQGVPQAEHFERRLEIATVISDSPNDHVAGCVALAEREFLPKIAGADNRDGSGASVRCMNDKRKQSGRLHEAVLHTYDQEEVKAWPRRTLAVPKGGTADGGFTTTDGIRAHFNFRADPDLGHGWIAMRRAACGCSACKAQLRLL